MNTRVTKRCPRCRAPGEALPIDRFPPSRSRRDGVQGYCRECYRILQRNYRRQNGDRRRAHVRRITAAVRARNQANLLAYLREHPCVDCGLADVRVLEFHHVGGKTRAVSVLVQQGCSWARIAEEMLKCVVLCANCHRIREVEHRGSFRAEEPRKAPRKAPRVREPAPAHSYEFFGPGIAGRRGGRRGAQRGRA